MSSFSFIELKYETISFAKSSRPSSVLQLVLKIGIFLTSFLVDDNILSSTKKDVRKIPIFKTSCKTDEGLEDFANEIVSYFNSMKENDDIQEKKILRYNRRIKSIIEKDILNKFWNEERISHLDSIDKSSIKSKSPYELVDEIKGKE